MKSLKTRDDIGRILNEMGLNGLCAEIGVEHGINAEVILSKSAVSHMVLVDAWRYIEGHDPKGFGIGYEDWEAIYRGCVSRMEKFGDRVSVMRMTSAEAASKFEDGSFDFVYIDANHMSPHIDNDIELWMPKIKSGGILGGHDYYDKSIEGVFQCDVKSVVDAKFGARVHVTEDEVPSWYVTV